MSIEQDQALATSAPPSSQPGERPPDDRRLLTAIKILLALIVIALLLAGDEDRAWPLVTWPMFDRSGSKPPAAKVSAYRIRAVAADGQIYSLTSSQLSPALPEDAVERLIEKTFDKHIPDSKRQAAYSDLTALVVSALPGVTITQIEGWELTWRAQIDQPTPLNVNAPDQQTHLGSFTPADSERAP